MEIHPDMTLEWLRYYADQIHKNRDNESVEAISLADHVTELDKHLSSGGGFPSDWKPF